jgi:DNA helicase II / ATP-dependent DNA helicase PcrA
MRQIADLHIHSKFSRACSKDLTLENIDKACRMKGIDIIATGDFTFPEWFEGIKESLRPFPPTPPLKGRGARSSDEGVLYYLKTAQDDKIKFILSTELALIYKKNDRCRRIHMVVIAPNIAAVQELNNYLDKKYNIRSDGRPILGMSIEELCRICFNIHPKFLIFPAHIWTPWFAIFGSKSGFDSWEEAFGEYSDKIFAYETGLSSDPEMNWCLSSLDSKTLLSNSDAHSLPNLGREANVFQLNEVSYDSLYNVIANTTCRDEACLVSTAGNDKSYLDYTIEFYPEEGMYHLDGHRDCKIRFTPAETKKHKGVCPVCGKKLTVGVEYRVDELADRPLGFKPEGRPGFRKLVELDKIIAEAFGVKSRTSTKVQAEYQNIIKQAGTEMAVLLDIDIEEIKKMTRPEIAEGVRRVRAGELIIKPGFDGQYGAVEIFSAQEKKDNKQQKLF